MIYRKLLIEFKSEDLAQIIKELSDEYKVPMRIVVMAGLLSLKEIDPGQIMRLINNVNNTEDKCTN